MGKIDIEIMTYGTKLEKLKDEVRGLILKDVFDKDIIIKKVNEIAFIKDMFERWEYMKDHNNIIVSGMFTEEGTEKVNKTLRNFIVNLCVKYDEATAIKSFNEDIDEIEKTHSEVTDSDVRDSIKWYIQPLIEIYGLADNKLNIFNH
jgi:hypothetical protein